VSRSPSNISKISPARRAAYEVLLKVETKREFTSGLLPEYEDQLQPMDRGLCHELVLGTLRRQLYLDRVIDDLTGGKRLDIEVRIILRLGIFQLAFLERVPAHAAVNDAVTLTNRVKKSSARGLVNAVLRKASRGLPELTFTDDVESISVETSHPRWLIERWAEQIGMDQTTAIAAANNETPTLAFRRTFKDRDIDLKAYERSEIVDGCYIAESFDANLRQMADAGLIYFQDEGSQLVADAVRVNAGERFLDVCAAPGGKTTAIAVKANQALLVAGDITERRVRLLRETCIKQRLGEVNIVQYDAAYSLPFADGTFDVVFVDAPCTGTGTIRHNPEIRYFVEPEDFLRMQGTQLAILTNAAKLVNPGGRLIYSTCSLEPEENEYVAQAFLAAHPRFQATPPAVPQRFLTSQNHARTRPDGDQTDGFFLASFNSCT
jgi:16S rRNA (cytosine967-C5)-methyltransferase